MALFFATTGLLQPTAFWQYQVSPEWAGQATPDESSPAILRRKRSRARASAYMQFHATCPILDGAICRLMLSLFYL